MPRQDLIHLAAYAPRAAEPWRLLVPATARRRLGLPRARHLPVRFQPSAPIMLLPVHTSRSTLPGHPTLIPLRAEWRGGQLHTAPVVGILAANKGGHHGFYGLRSNFRGILWLAARKGLPAVVFTPRDVEGERVHGHVFTREHRWRRVVLPLPSVIYNRVPDRESECSPEVAGMKALLVQRGVPLVNGDFFDKRTVHTCLLRSRSTARWLPRTEVLESQEQIRRWLEQHPLVYLKRSAGRAGDGTMRVERKDGRVLFTLLRGHQQTKRRFASIDDAADAIWRLGDGHDYLLQQGVELAAWMGRPFDLCLLVQKDGRGRWTVTGLGASVASRGRIVTQAGTVAKAEQALAGTFGSERAAKLLRGARHMALTVACALERRLSNHMGRLCELSIDAGVSTDGRLWFFEANSKPMPSQDNVLRLRSRLRLLRHCEHLARACQSGSSVAQRTLRAGGPG